ncbi:MAG: glycine cleavage system protein GcvH [Candidatus Parvarchaeota archaeon]|nr:glycine cleavage system protein GcvH [Candidatus Jingweiarchaeum tengchongense]MCW1298517.1 glycine cleavage system protein GcvH [Candidatus Jingweiarchaeum tengchongense]MCW1300237.1 glycine cleavage system protein GcvH [Candidatus Jingweiarchaeum tengchongense]MCW1304529.1 glycine cleavage system protein GcvH [Candidatus Jingweiarchaeum tengchongense]MCW1305743.1 glycine cleavage system protein GcvH [Candidatus Jingweiarchaeum tengchongense]
MSEKKTLNLKQELINEIEKAMKTGHYQTVDEFISEAIKLRIDQLMRKEALPDEKRDEILTKSAFLLYSPKHTWAQITPKGTIRVGISEYAQKYLKGIANVRTEPVGTEIKKEDPFGMAETWMFIFDLYSPVSGEIVGFNENLIDEPYIINSDPYGKGWIVEIRPKDISTFEKDLKELLSENEYNKFVSKLENKLVT